jgi:hypothetical protein
MSEQGSVSIPFPHFPRNDVDRFLLIQLTASIKENPRLAAAAAELQKAGIGLNEAVGHALKGMEETAFVRTVRFFPSLSSPSQY